MESKSKRYPDYLKSLAPRIHLSVTREYDLIYSYYNINKSEVFNFHDDPRKVAECKVCGDKISIVCGSGINSANLIKIRCLESAPCHLIIIINLTIEIRVVKFHDIQLLCTVEISDTICVIVYCRMDRMSTIGLSTNRSPLQLLKI